MRWYLSPPIRTLVTLIYWRSCVCKKTAGGICWYGGSCGKGWTLGLDLFSWSVAGTLPSHGYTLHTGIRTFSWVQNIWLIGVNFNKIWSEFGRNMWLEVVQRAENIRRFVWNILKWSLEKTEVRSSQSDPRHKKSIPRVLNKNAEISCLGLYRHKSEVVERKPTVINLKPAH